MLGVAIGIGRHPLQLVLGGVDHDLLAVVADAQVLPRDPHVALAHAQETADAQDHAVDLAVGVDVDRFDLAHGLVLRVLDVAADQLLGVGAGRHGRHLGIGRPRRRGGLLGVGGTGADRQQAGNKQVLDHETSMLFGACNDNPASPLRRADGKRPPEAKHLSEWGLAGDRVRPSASAKSRTAAEVRPLTAPAGRGDQIGATLIQPTAPANALSDRKLFDGRRVISTMTGDELLALCAEIRTYHEQGPVGALAIVGTYERTHLAEKQAAVPSNAR